MIGTSINKDLFSHFPIDYNGAIWEKLTPLDFTRKTVLPRDVLCFLENGLVRKYLPHDDPEKELSVDFYFSGDIFTAKADSQTESQFMYAPVNSGKLWYLDMAEVRRMFFESELCSATQKLFVDERLREKMIREVQLLRTTPNELYGYLLENKPHYVQQVPLKFLASYIGITPQALSRIRRKIT